MDNCTWSVYKHTNKINGKVYIGITSLSPEKRWGHNGHGYCKQPFYKAIKKYGWDGFTHEVLFDNLSLDEASKLERDLIIQYNALGSNGYNSKEGGIDSMPSVKCFQRVTEVNGCKVICIEDMKIFNTMAEAAEAYNTSYVSIKQSCIDKWRIAGNRHWMFLEEYNNNGIIIVEHPNNFHTIKVICYETQQIYNSVNEAERALKIFGISKCCKHQVDTCGGLHWAYYEEGQDYSTIPKPQKTRGKKVICINTEKIYSNSREAADDIGCCRSAINNCCLGKANSVFGLKFKYL